MTDESSAYNPQKPFVSVSDIIYVDFVQKKIICENILIFDKIELLREGLINHKRLLGHGVVKLVYDKAG
jgi:hypothetical protein